MITTEQIIDFDDLTQKRRAQAAIGCLRGPHKLTVEPYKPRRSLKANAYYWGVVIPTFQAFMREHGHFFHKDECHEFFLQTLCSRTVVDPDSGEVLATIGERSSKMNTEQFAKFVDDAIGMMQDRWGVSVPAPDEFHPVPA